MSLSSVLFLFFFFFFFFQAEDGIRDYKVTGVQTCALPIWRHGIKGPPLRPIHEVLGQTENECRRDEKADQQEPIPLLGASSYLSYAALKGATVEFRPHPFTYGFGESQL